MIALIWHLTLVTFLSFLLFLPVNTLLPRKLVLLV